MKSRHQRGFTLIELMIAISTFSVLLLVCFGAFIYLGHLYYKGATESRTNEIVRTIINDISQAIQFSGVTIEPIVADPPTDGWAATCIGHRKYSYRLQNTTMSPSVGVQLDPEATGYNFSAGSQKATSVFVVSNGNCAGTAVPTNTQQYELLDKNMRLLEFKIEPDVDSRLFTIDIAIAYGGDPEHPDLDSEIFVMDSNDGIIQCKPRQTFCAVNRLSTTVYRKVGLNY